MKPGFEGEPSRTIGTKSTLRVVTPPLGDLQVHAIGKSSNFFKDCSINGLRPALDPNKHWARRLIWIVLVVASVAFAIYQIQDRIAYYVSYPASTSVSIKQATALRFPQLTICNENQMRTSIANVLGFDEVLPEMFPGFRTPTQDANVSVVENANYTQQQWEEIRLQLAPSLDATFPLPIKWEMRDIDQHVLTPISTDMGQCFAFNGVGSNFTARQPGATFGLSLTMVTGQSDYLVVNSQAAGFRLLVHDPLEMPVMSQFGFYVSPGTAASVSIALETVHDLGRPYSDCVDDESYRLINCQVQCISDYLFTRCGCKMDYMPGCARNCTIIEIYKCSNPTINQFLIDLHGLEECGCRRECKSRIYDYSVSQSLLSDYFKAFIIANIAVEEATIVKDYVSVQIFFSTFKYTESSMVASYSFMALLSDIGGALGLLLGVTLLTVVEVLEFCLHLSKDLICICCDKKLRAEASSHSDINKVQNYSTTVHSSEMEATAVDQIHFT